MVIGENINEDLLRIAEERAEEDERRRAQARMAQQAMRQMREADWARKLEGKRAMQQRLKSAKIGDLPSRTSSGATSAINNIEAAGANAARAESAVAALGQASLKAKKAAQATKLAVRAAVGILSAVGTALMAALPYILGAVAVLILLYYFAGAFWAAVGILTNLFESVTSAPIPNVVPI